jgi:hypothetical protein
MKWAVRLADLRDWCERMDEVSARDVRVRRHRRWAVDAIERWQGSVPTLSALGHLTRDINVLLSELEEDVDSAWTDRLGECWGEFETIYATRLHFGGELTDEERSDISRAVDAIRRLASEGNG